MITNVLIFSVQKPSSIAMLLLLYLTTGLMGAHAQAVKANYDSAHAALLDEGYSYTTANGDTLTYYKKQGLYALPLNSASRLERSAAERDLSQAAGSQLDILSNHQLRGMTVIRLHDDAHPQALAQGLVGSVRTSLKSARAVFSPPDRQGDLLILPELIIKIADGVDIQTSLETLSVEFGLSYQDKLRFAERQFVLSIQPPPDNEAAIFELARGLMAQPEVEWAEPQMAALPQRQFNPDDPQYNQQWHLFNWGNNGALCDADTDTPPGWDILKSDEDASSLYEPVIAIIDDGVDLSHPDLAPVLWTNPSEIAGNGLDDDSNGCVDDIHGCDFQDDRQGSATDNIYLGDPNPQDNDTSSQPLDDDHGTAVAGLAVAQINNTIGVSGSAYKAKLLAVRVPFFGLLDCTDWANALRYAGKYADVVSASWSLPTSCSSSMSSAVNDVTSGTIANSRRFGKGSPVLVASGNSAFGWQKVTVTGISPGTHIYRWEFIKDGNVSLGNDTAWLDDITWPDGSADTFNAGSLGGFSNSGNALWSAVSAASAGNYARGETGFAARAGSISHNQYTRLQAVRSHSTGSTLSYWAWVSAEGYDPNFGGDPLKFYIDGVEQTSAVLQSTGYTNPVAFPASLTNTIAVGGSTDGAASGHEERIYYSQFGPELDFVVPTANQNQLITTTDRSGADGYSSSDYASDFGGTSASTPIAAGLAANLIAHDNSLSAADVRTALQEGAEQVYPYQAIAGHTNETGHGRLNLYRSLRYVDGLSLDNPLESCTNPGPSSEDDDFLLMMLPAILSGIKKQ